MGGKTKSPTPANSEVLDGTNTSEYNQSQTPKEEASMPTTSKAVKKTAKKTVTRRSRVEDKSAKPTETDESISDKIAELEEAVQAVADADSESTPSNPKAIKSEVNSVERLVNGILGDYDIGVTFDFTSKHKVMATVQSVKEGELKVTVNPSQWAQEVAQSVYDACYVSDDTVDPSTIDASVDGWKATLIC